MTLVAVSQNHFHKMKTKKFWTDENSASWAQLLNHCTNTVHRCRGLTGSNPVSKSLNFIGLSFRSYLSCVYNSNRLYSVEYFICSSYVWFLYFTFIKYIMVASFLVNLSSEKKDKWTRFPSIFLYAAYGHIKLLSLFQFLMPRWAKEIANKEPESRTPQEIHSIVKLMKQLKGFRRYSSKIQEAVCKALKYDW